MDLREAYAELELSIGASEQEVREARKLLAKVWHPDRHANDPDLQKKAEAKIADVNHAFELIRAANFPSSIEEPKPKPDPKPKPKPAPPPPPVAAPQIEFVPKRRVRWSVLLLVLAAVGVGTYFAIVKLGAQPTATAEPATPDARDKVDPPVRDAAIIATIDATIVAIAPDAPLADATTVGGATFGLGSTEDQVRAAQGEPTDRHELLHMWDYGFSNVTFKRGKVVGWWDVDDNLRVELVPQDPAVAAKAKTAGAYGIGSTKDEVIGVQGTPNQIESVIDETWHYGRASSVTFDDGGRVKGWQNVNGALHIRH